MKVLFEDVSSIFDWTRSELGRTSNFKWLKAALNLIEIKNPFGSVQTNPQADAW